MVTRAVILVGGNHKCARLNGVSFDTPTSLLKVAGFSLIEHQILKLCKIHDLDKIFLIGTYSQNNSEFFKFCKYAANKYSVDVLYLEEKKSEMGGTGGCLLQYRNEILGEQNKVSRFILINFDIVFNYDFISIMKFYDESIASSESSENHCITVKKFPSEYIRYFGSVVLNKENQSKVAYYVEKSTSDVSDYINCGVLVLSSSIFDFLESRSHECHDWNEKKINLFDDVLPYLYTTSNLYAYDIGDDDFVRVRDAGSLLIANLMLSKNSYENKTDSIIIDESSKISPTAKIGPNVSIGKNCIVDDGVRIVNALIFDGCHIMRNSLVKNAVIGKNSKIEPWARIDGYCQKSVFDTLKNLDKDSLFDAYGKLAEGPTIIGDDVVIKTGGMVFNCIIMPRICVEKTYHNEIIL